MRNHPFICPPECGGQIVVREYGIIDGELVRVTWDRSDNSRVFYVSRPLKDDEGDYWNGKPRNKRWRKVEACYVNDLLRKEGYSFRFEE